MRKDDFEEKEVANENIHSTFWDVEQQGFEMVSNRFQKIKVGGIFKQREKLIEIRKYKRNITPIKIKFNVELIIPKHKITKDNIFRYEYDKEIEKALKKAIEEKKAFI